MVENKKIISSKEIKEKDIEKNPFDNIILILKNHEERIINLEALNYRLKNI